MHQPVEISHLLMDNTSGGDGDTSGSGGSSGSSRRLESVVSNEDAAFWGNDLPMDAVLSAAATHVVDDDWSGSISSTSGSGSRVNKKADSEEEEEHEGDDGEYDDLYDDDADDYEAEDGELEQYYEDE